MTLPPHYIAPIIPNINNQEKLIVFTDVISVFVSIAHWKHYQSISGEILTYLKKKKIFLAQILTELEQFEDERIQFI